MSTGSGQARRPGATSPRYHLPAGVLGPLALAALTQRRRSFRADALAWVAGLRPPLRALGQAHLPDAGPGLIVVNHYARPGFRAWWITLAVSALVPADIHWIMTEAWTFLNRPVARRALRPASRWLLRRLARVYAFTAMPPMPPEPDEVAARAAAVRRVLSFARRTPRAVIGLAPEGRDFPGGVLGAPPPGAGRFMLQLAGLGLEIWPVAVYEAEGALCAAFGPRFRLAVDADQTAETRDQAASCQVMRAIAGLLPEALRGQFG